MQMPGFPLRVPALRQRATESDAQLRAGRSSEKSFRYGGEGGDLEPDRIRWGSLRPRKDHPLKNQLVRKTASRSLGPILVMDKPQLLFLLDGAGYRVVSGGSYEFAGGLQFAGLRNILRRALRKAGLPPLRFHDMRHLAGTLMSEAGGAAKAAQEILGHADVRTTLAIYTHTMRSRHDDSADKMAQIAGLEPAGNNRETDSSVKSEEMDLSPCFNWLSGLESKLCRSY
jgi:Phage integrase family